MLLISRPSESAIRKFVEIQSGASFSYPDVGATRSDAPLKYNIDHNRIRLGSGDECFRRAAEAVKAWRMFEMQWVELYWQDTPIEPGRTVAILVSHFGIWSLNAAKIVYTIDDTPGRFGFAYGTLADHAESGEERFSVEIDSETGEVWYDLFAFSQPNHFYVKLGYPFARMLQKRFAQGSLQAMRRAAGG